MSLTARHLEANGIPTIIVGSAIDIVEYCGAPRYVHVDFPLGNPCGKPFDEGQQFEIATQALEIFPGIDAPDTTVRLPYSWSEDNGWRDGYAQVTAENRAALLQMGEDRRQQQVIAKEQGIQTLNQIT